MTRMLTVLAVALPLLAASQNQGTPGTGGPALTLSVDASRTVQVIRGGMGASWHAMETPIPVVGDRSHGGSGWGGYPPAGDDAAWRQVYRQADWLGLDFCRVEVEQRIYEPERGQFTWDSPEMRILYRILDWCERRGADVFFQQMWGNTEWNAFPEFRDDPVKRVHSGPHSMQAFADGMAALLKHLVQVKRYTCIRWVCISNEPRYDWSWWQRPPNEPMSLRAGLQAVRRAFDREGIGIPLSGPDWTDLPELKPEEVDFDPFIGAYDLHSYFARFDWGTGPGYPLAQAEARLRAWKQWAGDRGKPLFLTEVGCMAFGWGGTNPGPSTMDAALKDAEMVVRALDAGVEGFNRWSFLNRNDLDGQWQLVDTWDPVAKVLLQRYVPKPNGYFAYGLMSRLTAKHSALVPTTVRGGQLEGTNRVFAAALRSPRGNLTWMIVNDAPRSWPARLQVSGASRARLHRYEFTPQQQDNPALQVAPFSSVRLKNGSAGWDAEIPARSLTVLSTFKLNPTDKGVTCDE